MKKTLLLLCALLVTGVLHPVMAQTQRADYQIKKVDVSFVDSPAYSVNPDPKRVPPRKWMQIEVEFQARPDFTAELSFNYYVYFNNRLFVGRVDHVNIQKGRELRSVAYMAPSSIAAILEGKTLSSSDLGNVSVTINQPGVSAPIALGSWREARGAWWESMKQETGFIVNKSETPFAPLAWDYYEALKPASAR